MKKVLLKIARSEGSLLAKTDTGCYGLYEQLHTPNTIINMFRIPLSAHLAKGRDYINFFLPRRVQ
jgi:hypothetical protein